MPKYLGSTKNEKESMTGEEKRKAEETYRKFWNDEER